MDPDDSVLRAVLEIMLEKLGTVLETFSAPKGYQGSVRPKVDNLKLIKEIGIENDKFAGKNPNRSIMIIGTVAYDIAKEHNIDIEPGSLGENMLLDFDPHTLKAGEQIAIGDAMLEVTELCTICKSLSVHDKALPRLLNGHRGVYCKITQSGIITKGLNICKQ
jgi:MOSC domain-containing protein YiiM